MQKRAAKIYYHSFLSIIACVCVLFFALTSCGTNSTTSGSPSPFTPLSSANPTLTITSTPLPTPTTSPAQAANGCPNQIAVKIPLISASVVLKSSNNNATVTVNQGSIIEVDLLFGRKWQGPANTLQHFLTVQTPSGYSSTTAKACIWHFTATSSGTAHLTFAGFALCARDQLCPMNVIDIEFTVIVK